jgi:hypothetical protein
MDAINRHGGTRPQCRVHDLQSRVRGVGLANHVQQPPARRLGARVMGLLG